jgi:hypothetical protein
MALLPNDLSQYVPVVQCFEHAVPGVLVGLDSQAAPRVRRAGASTNGTTTRALLPW